ncbi:hypothetical protein [uncultured Erythrobacter sp.]|uniref:hypothetical protein n=1 Tax=uncultured Erythrobacter sp. TaxID=263913 RepID=UPI002630A463|nr:hypothetical protein [uncultured Erythrobacter sp.]
MATINPSDRSDEQQREAERDGAPLGGTRAEAMQRLQVGLFGLFSMVLVVGVANIVYNRAQQTEDSAVPEAAPTTEPTEAPPQRDPLVDAGILPDVTTEPEAEEEATTVPDVPATEDTDLEASNDDPKDP